MPILFQINVVSQIRSTGHIVEEISRIANAHGWECYNVYGRYNMKSQLNTFKISSGFPVFVHGLQTRLFDNHGLGSRSSTIKLVEKIKTIKPDIIHLHNIHGYYINIEVLFDFLSKSSIPVVWTLHDCWSMTGHCVYFDSVGCTKWKTYCYKCPQIASYPKSLFADQSTRNYNIKKALFTSIKALSLVTVSKWLENIVRESFLKNIPIQTIHNGIDTSIFKPQKNNSETRARYCIGARVMILGVAVPWSKRKGLDDLIKLSRLLNKDEIIVLIGLDYVQLRHLPSNIIGIAKTKNIQELIDLFSAADLYVNPTCEDNFPTTNIEALACGTPIVTYRTGGSVEAVSTETGFIVEKGDIKGILNAISTVKKNGKEFYSSACQARAVTFFNNKDRFAEYIDLYEKLINKNPCNYAS